MLCHGLRGVDGDRHLAAARGFRRFLQQFGRAGLDLRRRDDAAEAAGRVGLCGIDRFQRPNEGFATAGMVPAEIEAIVDDFAALWRELPALVSRREMYEKISIYRPGILANLDSMGKGPRGRMKLGRAVYYPRYELMVWVASQVKFRERSKIDDLRRKRNRSIFPSTNMRFNYWNKTLYKC